MMTFEKNKIWNYCSVILTSDNCRESLDTRNTLIQCLSGNLTPREKSIFRIVTKSELHNILLSHNRRSSEIKDLYKQYAAAFYELLKNDKKEWYEDQQRNKETDISRRASSITNILEEKDIAESFTDYKNSEINEEKSIMMAEAARLALEFGEHYDNPCRIYIFDGYPTNIQQIKPFLSFSSTFQDTMTKTFSLIDAIISIRRECKTKEDATYINKSHHKIDSSLLKNFLPSNELLETSDLLTLNSMGQDSSISDDITYDMFEKASNSPSTTSDWTDITFQKVYCKYKDNNGIKPAVNMVKEIKALLCDLAIDFREFKNWLQNITLFEIPTLASDYEHEKLYKRYTNALNDIFPVEPDKKCKCPIFLYRDGFINCSAVLYAITNAIASFYGEDTKIFDKNGHAKIDTDNPSHWLNAEFGNYGDFLYVEKIKMKILLKYISDSHLVSCSCSSFNIKSVLYYIDSITEWSYAIYYSSDIIGVGCSGRKGMPVKPHLSENERGIMHTELRSFTHTDIQSFLFIHQLNKTCSLLSSADPYINWSNEFYATDIYVEDIACCVLPQRLSIIQEHWQRKFKHYVDFEDKLILIIPTSYEEPSKQFSRLIWEAHNFVSCRVAFNDWRLNKTEPLEYMTPRTIDAARACVSITKKEMAEANITVYNLTLSEDGCTAHVYKKDINNSVLCWLSINRCEGRYGLRPVLDNNKMRDFQSNFWCTLHDDSILSFQRLADGSFNVSHTYPRGLTVEIFFNGNIVQRYESIDMQDEKFRVLLPSGVTIIALNSGEKVYLYPNGTVAWRSLNENSYQITLPDGSRYLKNDQGNSILDSPIDSIQFEDPDTEATITKRNDGTLIVRHLDGSLVCRHFDGTTYYSRGSLRTVLVTKYGYCDVSVNINSWEKSTKNRQSKSTDIVLTEIFDALSGTINKIIRKIPGRNIGIELHSTGESDLVFSENGTVEYNIKCKERDHTVSVIKSKRSDRWVFDCVNNSLCVQSNNKLIAKIELYKSDDDSTKKCIPSLSPYIEIIDSNHKLLSEPYVFIVNGDGSAKEIIRKCDLKSFTFLLDKYFNKFSKIVPIEPDNPLICNFGNSMAHIDHSFLETKHELTTFPEPFGILLRINLPPTVLSLLPSGGLFPYDYPYESYVYRHLKEYKHYDTKALYTIRQGYERWQQWRNERIQSISSFRFNETRTKKEKDDATLILPKLKNFLKQAKSEKKPKEKKDETYKQPKTCKTTESDMKDQSQHTEFAKVAFNFASQQKCETINRNELRQGLMYSTGNFISEASLDEAIREAELPTSYHKVDLVHPDASFNFEEFLAILSAVNKLYKTSKVISSKPADKMDKNQIRNSESTYISNQIRYW